MGTTPQYLLPYPELSEPADVPLDMKELAQRIEAVLGGIAAVPTGVVSPFAGSAAPTGWLLCDGGAVSRTTYAALFAVIGSSYGAGDGSATFNVPNMRGRVPTMLDAAQPEFDAFGKPGGAKVVTLDATQMPGHVHTVNSHSHGGGYHDHGTWTGIESADHSHSGWTDSQGNHNHLPGGDDFARTAGTAGGGSGTARLIISSSTASTTYAGAHTHNVGTSGRSAAHQHQITAQSVIAAEAPGTDSKGGGLAHQNLQPFLVVNFVIKT